MHRKLSIYHDEPRAKSEKEIFGRALELSAGREREDFLNQACGNDSALRARVLHLIVCHESPEFLRDAPTMAMHPKTLPAMEKPGHTIGRYKLREVVGEGGCGMVYVAEQQEPVRRRVALKVIKLGMDTKSVVARFEADSRPWP
jgi:hypothetical protein